MNTSFVSASNSVNSLNRSTSNTFKASHDEKKIDESFWHKYFIHLKNKKKKFYNFDTNIFVKSFL